MTQVAISQVYGDVEENWDAAEFGGYVAQAVDEVYAKVKPRWSAVQREKLERAGRPADDKTLRRLIEGFPADWANTHARHKKLIGLDNGVAEFVPRVPVAADAGEGAEQAELEAYNLVDGYRAEAQAKKKARNEEPVHKYYLHQIFSDISVAEKLMIDAGMMIVISRTAVANAKAACDIVVSHAKANGMNIAVRVGNYAVGRKASRNSIMAASYGMVQDHYQVEVIGKKMLIEGVSGKGMAGGWTLTCDLWQMPEADAVCRMVANKGVTHVNTLFAEDLLILGIQLVPDGVDYGFDHEFHVGEYDASVAGNRVSVFGEETSRSSRGVFPVMFEDKVMASAVYAGNGQFFVNWHVISDLHQKMQGTDAFVCLKLDFDSDDKQRISLLRQVARDTWLAELEVGSEDLLAKLETPVCRMALEGEEVVAVYATPSGVECTDSVHVSKLDGAVVCVPRFPQARIGLSGAALIAVSDGALLGSYTGANRFHCFASSVDSRVNTDWVASTLVPRIAPRAYVSSTGAQAIYGDLQGRGLGHAIESVVKAFKPLFADGKQVGNEYVHPGGAMTSTDVSVWDVTDSRGVTLPFVETAGGGMRPVGETEVFGTSGRAPLHDEYVFAVGRDERSQDEGFVFSDLMRVAWVSGDGSRCRLNDVPNFEGKPMMGALLVSLADCEPIGLISKTGQGQNRIYSEVTTWAAYMRDRYSHSEDVIKLGLFKRLSARFPRLNTFMWTDSDVRSLVVGDTASVVSCARGGESAWLASVLGRLWNSGRYDMDGQVVNMLSNDAWVCTLCNRVLPGSGRLFGSSVADRVNTFKIFLGLVFMRDGGTGLDYVLDEVGLFDAGVYFEFKTIELAGRYPD